MKQITSEEMRILEKNKKIVNTKYGYIDTNGNPIGFKNTRHRKYVESRFVDMARELAKT
jgi:hypothetical protein